MADHRRPAGYPAGPVFPEVEVQLFPVFATENTEDTEIIRQFRVFRALRGNFASRSEAAFKIRRSSLPGDLEYKADSYYL
jgi:hypothetical protein